MEHCDRQRLRAILAELRRVLASSADSGLRALGLHPTRPGSDEGGSGGHHEPSREPILSWLEARQASGASQAQAFAELVARATARWANRLLVLRCLEARGVIDEVVVLRAAYGGLSLRHARLRRSAPASCAGEDGGLLMAIELACAELAPHVRCLFGDADGVAALLPPSATAVRRCVRLLSFGPEGADAGGADGTAEPLDALFRDPTALGWAYELWNSAQKEAVFDRLRARSGVKLEGEALAPATQLFTDRHHVRLLLECSLGRLGLAMLSPALKGELPWHVEGLAPPTQLPASVRELRVLDPACGSGHFLVEAFELLYRMYELEGVLRSPAQICRAILEDNLHGIDIDPRAVQLAQAALWMKAEERSPGIGAVRCHLVATDVRWRHPERLVERLLEQGSASAGDRRCLELLCEGLTLLPELGGLVDWEAPGVRGASLGELVEALLALAATEPALAPSDPDALRALRRIGSLRFHVIATNPPYAGYRLLAPRLKRYLDRTVPDAAIDLYVTFVARFFGLLAPGGTLAFISPASWTTSVETAPLRRRLLAEGTPLLVAALGQRVFDSAPLVYATLGVVAREPWRPGAELLTLRPTTGSGAAGLRAAIARGAQRWPLAELARLAGAPLLPAAPLELLAAAEHAPTVGDCFTLTDGVWTGSTARDVRYGWEVDGTSPHWRRASGGQGYARWYAPTCRRVRRLALPPEPSSAVAAAALPGVPHVLEYPRVAGGRLSARLACLEQGEVVAAQAGVVRLVPRPTTPLGRVEELAAIFNGRLGLVWLRTLVSGLNFNPGYAARVPLGVAPPGPQLVASVRRAFALASELAHWDLTGDDFEPALLRLGPPEQPRSEPGEWLVGRVVGQLEQQAELLALESEIDALLVRHFGLSAAARAALDRVAGLPSSTSEVEVSDDEAGERLGPARALEAKARELGAAPRVLFAAVAEQAQALLATLSGPGASMALALAVAPEAAAGQERSLCSAARELLGAELRRWGEELLGWAAIELAREQGIVWLTGPNARALEQRICARLADEPERATRLGLLLEALLGTPLRAWALRQFFGWHVRRHRRRPCVWQIQSERGRRGRAPTFACWLHVASLDSDTLPKLRAELRGPVRAALECELREPASSRHGTRAAELRRELAALGELDTRLARLQDAGHAPCRDDGVRVNIAPWQREGLLAMPVLAATDVERAIQDHALWRAQAHADARDPTEEP